MTAEVISVGSGDFTAITLPPKIEIPAAPQTIARPAVPVMVSGNIDEAITIAPTTFESNPISVLPPPTTPREASTERDLAKAPIFTPFTVKPEIRNRGEVAQALARMYPPLLRDAGIGGTVLVWFFINAEGKVERTLVREGSGHADLDEAALKVADIITFTPALNRDKRVPVWISLPITFTVR
jgi:protein TonB